MERAFGEAASFGGIAARALVAGSVYLGLWWGSTLSPDERRLLGGLVAGAARRLLPGGSNTPVR